MNVAQRAAQQSRAGESTLVIMPQESGHRVYAVSDPSRIFDVRDEDGRWTCTCPDFGYHQSDPHWRCEHIRAAAPWLAPAAPLKQQNGTIAPPPSTSLSGDGTGQPSPALMLIRRSVSPDGRIDSVSVEFTIPVEGISSGAIKDKALRTLALQKEIVSHFLGGQTSNGDGAIHAVPPAPGNGHHATGQGPVPARILEIGEVQGKWGPRLCLTFQVNGNRARLFGSAKQLATRLAEAGFDFTPAALHAGLRLNLDCLVSTQPSEDGRYVNVGQLYPVHPNGSAA